MTKRLSEDFGAEGRAAHATEHHMLELSQASRSIGKINEIVLDADHHIRHGQPTERVLDDLLMGRIVFPKRRVLAPNTAHHVALVSFLYRGAHCIAIFPQRGG